MINDWKLGMRMLRYAHGIKMNCIAAGLVMLLEIPAVILASPRNLPSTQSAIS